MRELKALAHQAKDDGCSPGLSPVRRAWTPISPRGRSPIKPCRPWIILSDPIALAAISASRRRRAAGSVLLEAVVPLDDLDIGRVAQSPSRLAHQPHQQVDRPARIGRDQQGDPVSECGQFRLLIRLEPRRADDQGSATFGTFPGDAQASERVREVDHDIHRPADSVASSAGPEVPGPQAGRRPSRSPYDPRGRSPLRGFRVGSPWIRWISRLPIRPGEPWMPIVSGCEANEGVLHPGDAFATLARGGTAMPWEKP